MKRLVLFLLTFGLFLEMVNGAKPTPAPKIWSETPEYKTAFESLQQEVKEIKATVEELKVSLSETQQHLNHQAVQVQYIWKTMLMIQSTLTVDDKTSAKATSSTKIIGFGEYILIECKIDGVNYDDQVAWTRDDALLSAGGTSLSRDEHVTLIPGRNPNTWSLVFTSVKIEDNGTYKCMVNPGTSGERSYTVELNVVRSKPMILGDFIGLREGMGILKLTCVIGNLDTRSSLNESIVWKKNNDIMKWRTRSERFGLYIKSIMTVPEFVSSEPGNYTCEVPEGHSANLFI